MICFHPFQCNSYSKHLSILFRKRKKEEEEEEKTNEQFENFHRCLRNSVVPRSNFFHARYICKKKKKKERLEYKRLVTQIPPRMLRRKTTLSPVLLKHQAWSPVVATYNFAHEWATPISRAQKKISCKRGGRHHVLTRVPAWWTLVRGHQFLTVVHPVSNTLSTFKLNKLLNFWNHLKIKFIS